MRDSVQPIQKENFLQVSVLGAKLVLKGKTWEIQVFVHYPKNAKKIHTNKAQLVACQTVPST